MKLSDCAATQTFRLSKKAKVYRHKCKKIIVKLQYLMYIKADENSWELEIGW